jgi:hypothetical protein
MPGVKIKISTEEARVATERLRKDLNSLGAQAVLTEAQVKQLETRLTTKMSADKTTEAMTRLTTSMGLSKFEAQALAAKLGVAQANVASLESATQGLSSTFKMMAGIVASIGLYKLYEELKSITKESTLIAARVETMTVVLHSLGRISGISADRMDGFVEGVKKMGITTGAAQNSIARMIQAQLDLSKSSQLARVAQDAAVIANTNSSEAMEMLIHGITTMRPITLRQLGIIVDLDGAFNRYAMTVGRTADELTEAEKQQVTFNEVLEKGKLIAGTYEAAMETVGKQINSLPRFIEAVKERFGELFTPALGLIIQDLIKYLKQWEKALIEAQENGDMERWAHKFSTSVKSVIDGIDTMTKFIKENGQEIKEWGILIAQLFILGKISSLLGTAGLSFLKFSKDVGSVTLALQGLSKVGMLAAVPMGAFAVYKGFDYLSKRSESDYLDPNDKQYKDEIAQIKEETARTKELIKLKQDAMKWSKEHGVIKDQSDEEARVLEANKNAMNEINRMIKEESEKVVAEKKRLKDQDLENERKWAIEVQKIGKGVTEQALVDLKVQYDQYDRVVKDKVALAQWFVDKELEIRNKNKKELIGYYQQLYQKEGLQEYQTKAIDLSKDLLDAEEKIMIDRGLTVNEAATLRMDLEKSAIDQIEKWIYGTVEQEQQAADERVEITRRMVEQQQEEQAKIINPNIGEYTGMPVGSGTGWTEYHVGGQTYYSKEAADAAMLRIQTMIESEWQHKADMWRAELEQQAKQKEIDDERARMEKAQIENMKRLNEENEKYTQALKDIDLKALADAGKVTDLNGLMSSIYGAYGSIGMGDQVNATRLALMRQMFASPSVVAGFSPEDIMSNLSEYIGLIADSYEKEVTARKAIIDALKTETDFRERMSYSDLAPTTSYEAMMKVYEAKITGATTAEGYQEFISFIESDFLPYMKAYTGGNTGDYQAIWESIFGAGGTLEDLTNALGGQTDTEDPLLSLQTEANAELQSIADLLSEGGALHDVLSEFAGDQVAYLQSFIDAMEEQTQPIKDTAQYSAATAFNTALLENLIKFIGEAEVYEVNGKYYNEAQVKAMAEAAASVGGAFQLESGGAYYTSLSQLGDTKNVTPVNVAGPGETPKYEMPAISSPVNQVSLPAYQLGTDWYTKQYLQTTIASNASATGKYTLGGQTYTTAQLEEIVAGAGIYKPKDFDFAGNAGAYTPSTPSWASNWGAMASGWGQPASIIANYNASMGAPVLSYPGWDRFEPQWNIPAWASYNAATGQITGRPGPSYASRVGDYETFSLGGTVWSGNYSQQVTPRAVSVPIAAPTLSFQEFVIDNYTTGTGHYVTRYYTGRWNSNTNQWYGEGGLTHGPSGAGELGPEWIVPTYEPQRSSFLKDVGADPQLIANAVAKAISGAKLGGKDQQVIIIQVDGRELIKAIVKNGKKTPELAEFVRSL